MCFRCSEVILISVSSFSKFKIIIPRYTVSKMTLRISNSKKGTNVTTFLTNLNENICKSSVPVCSRKRNNVITCSSYLHTYKHELLSRLIFLNQRQVEEGVLIKVAEYINVFFFWICIHICKKHILTVKFTYNHGRDVKLQHRRMNYEITFFSSCMCIASPDNNNANTLMNMTDVWNFSSLFIILSFPQMVLLTKDLFKKFGKQKQSSLISNDS